MGYSPVFIGGMKEGLVQSRQEFLLPNDAYPVLQNVVVWREQLRRRPGLTNISPGNPANSRLQLSLSPGGTITLDGSGNGNLITGFSVSPSTAVITPGTVTIVSNAVTYTDPSQNGTLSPSGTINYTSGAITIAAAAGHTATATFSIYPMLPGMGVRTREINLVDNEPTIIWDTQYAYQYNGTNYVQVASSTPTSWTGSNANFFWSTNYWMDNSNNKLMWITNFSSTDPIYYYNGTTFTSFAPTVDGTNYLQQCLALLPYRGRLLAFNTVEGTTLAGGTSYYQRIRWSAINNPLGSSSWNDTIRGQGGYLDIPTSENITAVGFVRDNLVVCCERSTWQLRYTGRSISPFQIERVNSELGAYSLFSAVQFDTSLVGVGDKGIVECDSAKAVRIDIKIPDLVFNFSQSSNAPQRVCGIRDIQQRLAYWSYVDSGGISERKGDGYTGIYPNRRLIYNYENDSWAIFTDSITAMGFFQSSGSVTWANAKQKWKDVTRTWAGEPALFPNLIGVNQQGFVFYLGNNLGQGGEDTSSDQQYNDPTLAITNITGNSPNPTVVTCPNHNLVDYQVVQISGIPTGTPFNSLNGQNFGIQIVDGNNFQLWQYDSSSDSFNTKPQEDASGQTFIGIGYIATLDNFVIQSKKFNFLDQGQNVQLGYVDLLMSSSFDGQMTMNVYADYNSTQPVNAYPQNDSSVTGQADDFFNTVVNTSQQDGVVGSKYMQRVFCATRAAFLTIEYTFSNQQLVDGSQQQPIEIDAQVIWMRPAGLLRTF